MAGPNKPSRNDKNGGGDNKKKAPVSFLGIVLWAVVLVLLLNTCVSSMQNASTITVSYTEFREWVSEGYVDKVQMDTHAYYFTVKAGSPPLVEKAEEITSQLSQSQHDWFNRLLGGNVTDAVESVITFNVAPLPVDDPELISLMQEHGVDAQAELVTEGQYMLSAVISYVLPILITALGLVLVYRYMFKKMGAGGGLGGIGGVGKANAKVYMEKSTGVTFRDVAGQDEAKESLNEIIDFLHNPQKYTDIGAKLPKGALLVGPPGTGKTLLAKAVAGEANVPFFSMSGSEFVEMFVGMGASKVRDLFNQAKEKAPCIVFIDEIDAIGQKRSGGQYGGNDEREQTLNQLLTEMDGFEGNNGVIILAATNRPESLDPALTRPGRFDRRVPVELPDLLGREAILKVHAKKIKVAEDVDFSKIARMASGASGAELANIVNEAALRAVRDGRRFATQADLEESIEVVIAGYQKKNAIMTDHEKKIVSYHEIGHALVAALQTHSAPVQKITIVPRTSGALGYTMQVEEGNHYLLTKEEIENKIATFTGGRAAEEVVFGSVTTGASNDIEQATKLARAMITRYGMSDEFGMVALETVTNQYLGGDASLACSAETQTKIDQQVVALVQKQHDKAVSLLTDNREKLDQLAQYLYEKETITGEEFMHILNG